MEDPNFGRKVRMFRCHIDPHIPPKPRNAFVIGDGADQLPGEAIWYSTYIELKAKSGIDYGIAITNLQNWVFEPREAKVVLKKVKAE